MDRLVRPCQSAFIQKRSILDNFVYVQSLTKLFRSKKTPSLLLKIDIAKAFDSLSWEFLIRLLHFRGFGIKWANWLSILLSSATTRVLVNGDLTEAIQCRQGLQQGDPLSPLLLVIEMDCLATIFDAALRGGVSP